MHATKPSPSAKPKTRLLASALLASSLLVTGCAPRFIDLVWDDDRPMVGGDPRRAILAAGRLPITQNNHANFHLGGEASHAAIFRLISEARESLYVEMFIFRDDPTGREVADALIERRRQGLDVRVRLDSLGIEYGKTDFRILSRLKEGGVSVQINNPWYLSPAGFNVTHRKLFIADAYRVLTGGVNIGDDYRYHYEDVMIEVWGAAARQIAGTFAQSWGGDLYARLPAESPDDMLSAALSMPTVPWGDEPIQVAVTEPGAPRGKEIRRAYLAAINGARKRLDLAFPYLWDDAMIDAIARACRRGVEVRILLPDWSSHDIFHLLNLSNAKELADLGARISCYGDRFMHLKYLAIDDAWASLGSANGDTRSLVENYELNLFFHRPTTVEAIRRTVFDRLWSSAKPTRQADFHVPSGRAWLIPLLESLDHWF